MKRIDLVYFHIHGPDDSQELRFALRSIEKHFENKNYQIHIIGEKPTWLSNEVNFIPVNRIAGMNHAVLLDIINKFHLVCNLKEIGSEFYRMMDDIYFINPVQKADLDKLYALNDFAEIDIDKHHFSGSAKWAKLMRNSVHALKERNLTVYNYANHLPRRYTKNNIIKLFSMYNIPAENFLPNMLYFNTFHKKKPDAFLLPFGAGIKLGLYKGDYTTEDLHRMRGENIFMNNSTTAYNSALVLFLMQLFPHKSKFEI